MSDTIYREDAIKAMEQRYEDILRTFKRKVKVGEKAIVLDMIGCVKNLPSADRPQGEWIRTGRTNIYGGIEVQCSNCGDKVMVQHLEDEWYCRHCGADMGMKGADDE